MKNSISMKTIFRADANAEIGMGHFMRCFSLAQAIQGSGEVAFVTNSTDKIIHEKLKEQEIPVFSINSASGSRKDAEETIEWVKRFGADWLVLDGYDFNSNYQKNFNSQSVKTLLIDDMGQADTYWVNIILNQNIYAAHDLYEGAQSFTKLLLGSDYTLLRKEFLDWRDWKREIPETARKMMITLGGSDPNNILGRIVDSLSNLKKPNFTICVVAGQLNPYYNELYQKIGIADGSVILKSHIDDMPKQIAWTDIVLSAGGSTCYELAFMATPFITVEIAQNQIRIAQCLEKCGVSINLGWFEDLTSDNISRTISELIKNQSLRKQLSDSGKMLIDGNGASRVIESMLKYPALGL